MSVCIVVAVLTLTFRCPEVGTRGRFIGFPSRCLVPRNESRRSLGYKGGVTRGREEQPQVNCSIKRGSPITKMLALEEYGCIGKFDLDWVAENVGKPIRKVKKSHYPDSRLTPD